MTTAFSSSRNRQRRRRGPYRLQLEPLEKRLLLTTFFVNSTGDEPDLNPGNGVCEFSLSGGTNCTLRAAIQEANALANNPLGAPDEIRFNIPGTGVQTIHVGSSGQGLLPNITDPVIIDGYTQPAASRNTLPVGDNANLLIELEMQSSAGLGLTITGGNSTVRGLVMNRFQHSTGFTGFAIRLQSNGNLIEGNFLGTDVTGTIGQTIPGLGDAIRIVGASDNTIGGTTAGARNVIAGMKGEGVWLDNGAVRNVIQGNYLGVNATGSVRLASDIGVLIGNHSANNIIGGLTSIPGTGPGNVISGNSGDDIQIFSFSDGNIIQGNLIGTKASGAASAGDLNHNQYGIQISTSRDTLVGGAAAGARNVISGHLSAGVYVDGNSSAPVTGTMVQGNFIGTDISGTIALGNGKDGSLGTSGVFIGRASGVVIGGSAAGTGNLISGNLSGLVIGSDETAGAVIQGNRIGTDVTGSNPLPNTFYGIRLDDGQNSTIGGSVADAGNTIAFNGDAGVFLRRGTGYAILGNSIFSNTGLGIAFRNDSGIPAFIPNDPGDGDTGPNKLQNFPEFSQATFGGQTLAVRYAVPSSNDDSAYPLRVEFFKADAAGQEGQTFLGLEMIGAGEAGLPRTFSFATTNFAARDKLIATATDQNGNTSEFSFPITPSVGDTTPPETAIDFPLPGSVTRRSVASAFSGIDDVSAAVNLTFECQLDNGGWTSCSSPQQFDLGDGPHTLSIRATDQAGNTDASPASVTWTVIAPTNELPDAIDDTFTVDQDSGIQVLDVLANDLTDLDQALAIVSITFASHGSVTLLSGGRGLAYTSERHFYGADSFTYSIEDGLGGRDSATIFVRVNGLPTAAFAADPDNGRPPLTVRLNGSASADSDGDSITSYRWDFGDNHSIETNLPGVAHAYSHFGRFLASLTVVDALGAQSAPATRSITVDSAPTAILDQPQDLLGPSTPVTLEGRKSSDPDIGDAITRYEWDFGDGTTLETLTSNTVHTYARAGNFTASLTVVDTLGLRSTMVKVDFTLNTAPSAVLDAPPSVGTPPIAVLLKGERSSDRDSGDSIARYLWNFGDGVLLETTAPNVTHTFAQSGDFMASLIVVDTFGLQSRPASSAVHVNFRPTADLKPVEPVVGPAPHTVTLDASRSTAGELGDRITSYLWSFGDGTHELTNEGQAAISHVYKGVGDFSPSVVVFDTFGAASAPFSIHIATSGVISGSVFEDANGNGQKENTEPAAGGVVVYWDVDQSGTRNATEPFVTTTATGANKGVYSLPIVGGTGMYPVRLDVPAAVTTKPAEGVKMVDLTATATAVNMQLGFFRLGTVTGIVFDDRDGNGSRSAATEPGIGGFQLFLDENDNQVPDEGEPTATTNGSGTYSFPNKVAPSFPFVPRILPRSLRAGQYVTNAGGDLNVSLSSGGSLNSQNLGIFTQGTVLGTVFEDVNGNGSYEAAVDRLLAGRTVAVFKDLNNNNQINAGEPIVGVRATDSQGHYEFLQSIPAGAWKVTQLLPAGSIASLPVNNVYPITVSSGSTFANEDFGAYLPASISGALFEDLNGDGARSPGEPGLSNWTVFLDANHNGTPDNNEPRQQTNTTGEYSFGNLRPDTYRVREAPPAGWIAQNPATRFRDITLTSGQSAIDTFFANYRPATISGTVFDDFDGLGDLDATDARLAGRTVLLDRDNNGTKDGAEVSIQTDTKGKYSLSNLRPGHYFVRMVPDSNEVLTAPSNGFYEITLASNQLDAGRNFGVFERGIIDVDVRDDHNGDGNVSGGGNPSLTGWRVFLDLNHNGTSEGDEPRVTTNGHSGFNSLLAGVYDVRIELQDGFVATTPLLWQVTINSGTLASRSFGVFELGTIAGKVLEWTSADPPPKYELDGRAGLPPLSGRTVFLDRNDNGGLDAGEDSSQTDVHGSYLLANVGPGLQHVREILPPGWISSPSTAEQQALMVSGRHVLEDATFPGGTQGVTDPTYFLNKYTGSISGTVLVNDHFHNLFGLAGAVVFIDANNNGVLDSGEASAVTDDSGEYAVTTPPNSSPNLKTTQNISVRLQLPLGFRMNVDPNNASSRTIPIPLTNNVLDFPNIDFRITPYDQLPIFDGFSRENSSLLGDDWREVTGDFIINGSKLQCGPASNVAIFNSPPLVDVEVEADVSSLSGGATNAGLVARYDEATGNMYVGLLVRRGSQTFAEIHKIVGGQTLVLASVVLSGTNGTLRFRVEGNQLTLLLGIHILTSATDTAPLIAGQVGVFLGAQNILDRFQAALVV